MTVSKFAVHYQTKPEWKPDPKDTVNIVARSAMKWVKVINAEEMAADTFPNQRVMARLWVEWDGKKGDDCEKDYYTRGAAGAREYFERLRPRYDQLKSMGILDVEGPNEPQASEKRSKNPAQYDHDWAVISEFYYEWARLIVAYGMRPWVFSNSTGTPELEVLRYMVNTIKLATDAGGGWAIHEYWAPSSFSDVGWHPLRIVRALDHLAALGYPRGTLRVCITEAGMDGGVIDEKHAKWGWKRFAQAGWVYNEPDSLGLGETIMTEELYSRHLDRVDDEYCQVPEIDGVCIYGANPNGEWASFVLTSGIIYRMAVKAGWNDGTQPAPEPTDMEQRIIARAHEIVIAANHEAALYRAGRDLGLVQVSHEDYELGFPLQVFRDPTDASDRLHIATWQSGQVQWTEDSN